MASGPITSWQIHRETVETVTDFIFLGSKIIADGDYSHEIKRCLLLRRKVMSNLDSIVKSRDITFPTKVRLVKAMVFPVVMYGCESWTIKKAEHRRIDASFMSPALTGRFFNITATWGAHWTPLYLIPHTTWIKDIYMILYMAMNSWK